jgi:hypothetical protein
MTRETVEEAAARAARTITRDQARNPQLYQAAKAEALKQGKEVIILDPQAPDPTANGSKADVVYLDDQILVRREAARDPRTYQKLRAEADKSNRGLLLVEDLSAIGDPILQNRVNEALSGKDPGLLKATQDHWAS